MTHGNLGLDGALCLFSPNDVKLPPFTIGFFFFFSVTWFLVLLASPRKEEEGEGETNEVEGGGKTSVSSGY